ncbi:hypothetical protein LJR231_000393 [Phyllobacterium sp. LjRoot231]|uniref:hypothetical protein n=1 Tax=Phyllobacterium sp. LjRoot231 TaxID=3342289 RepID=UPI003ECDB32E
MRGRALKLSASRRLVNDLMRFSIGIPRVTVQRHMNLGPLLQARMPLNIKPSWTVLFLKGYALLAQEAPELRRAYVKFPWPRLYEYPLSVASIAHEREHDGERVVLLSLIKDPEHRSVAELEALIHAARSRPVLEVKEFRRALSIARVPTPIRRLLMWLGLNIGRQRANRFGTFQLSVYSGLGAESLNPLTPLTTLLNYGLIGQDGSVNVRIHYDHRVMDGANVARALVRFEKILNGTVADEVKLLSQGATVTARQEDSSR